MTIVQTSALEYIGSFSDEVAVLAGSGITPPFFKTPTSGATFFETDTDRKFMFNGTDWWLLENRIISEAHKRIHDGEMWEISAVATGVANNASLDLVVSVGGTPFHVAMAMAAEGSALVEMYEDTTLNATPGGVAATVANANRVTGDAGAPTALVGPTIDADGDLLIGYLSAGGFGGVSPGVNGDRDTEQILAPSTNYLFRLTNIRGTAAALSWALTGYEGALV